MNLNMRAFLLIIQYSSLPVSPFPTWSLDCHTIALEASVPSKCDPQFDCYLSKYNNLFTATGIPGLTESFRPGWDKTQSH